ncbi:MAG: tetratricopeptide repeat protein [Planctomycetaceae bacterium]|nr:tetratricopeptide repeat protein [Planctomycetaceae bacterium]
MTVPISDQSPSYPETVRQNGELAAMKRMLEVSESCFSLSVAICNNTALRNHLVRRLAESATLQVISIPESTVDVYQAVLDRVNESTPKAIFIVDLEASVPSREFEQLTFISLNASRDLWQRRFTCPVVFWLPAYAANLMAIHAKDFWRYRSHRFEFVADTTIDEMRPLSYLDFDHVATANLSANEKWFRVAELEQRVRDVEEASAAYLGDFVAQWQTERAFLLAELGELKQAEQIINALLQSDEYIEHQATLARSYRLLGNIHFARGDLSKAEEAYRKALDIDETVGQLDGMVSDYNNLGNVQEARHNYAEATSYLEKSLEICGQLDREDSASIIYGNLGIVCNAQGDTDAAEHLHHKALELAGQVGRHGILAMNFSNLGNVYSRRGDWDEAERMYRKALEINESLGNRVGMAINWCNLGTLHKNRGEWSNAREMWQESLELYKQLGSTRDVKRLRDLLEKHSQ